MHRWGREWTRELKAERALWGDGQRHARRLEFCARARARARGERWVTRRGDDQVVVSERENRRVQGGRELHVGLLVHLTSDFVLVLGFSLGGFCIPSSALVIVVFLSIIGILCLGYVVDFSWVQNGRGDMGC